MLLCTKIIFCFVCALQNVISLIYNKNHATTRMKPSFKGFQNSYWERKTHLYLSFDDHRDEEQYTASINQDWRLLRYKLISQGVNYGSSESSNSNLSGKWAHTLRNVEAGCLILDTGDDFFIETQQYFRHSAIFIIRHDEEGTVGLILNRPTHFRMGDLVHVQDTNLRPLPGLEDCKLYMGGDVGGRRSDGMDCVNFLHDKPYTGATKVIDGVYLGGLNEALIDIMNNKAKSEEFKFFAKYCGWAKGQLEQEIAAGCWFVCATDTSTIHEQITNTQQYWLSIIYRMGGQELKLDI